MFFEVVTDEHTDFSKLVTWKSSDRSLLSFRLASENPDDFTIVNSQRSFDLDLL